MSEAEDYDINEINKQVISEFRSNHGKVLTGRFANTALVLLTTTGAKTGETRIAPLMYVRAGDRLIVFASKNAGPKHPQWYFNVLANPDVTVEVNDEKYATRAEELSGDERQRVWDESVRQFPFLAEMQARTPRQLPIIAVEKR